MGDLCARLSTAIRTNNADPLLRYFNINFLMSNADQCRSLLSSRFSVGQSPWTESLQRLLRVPLEGDTKRRFDLFSDAISPIYQASLDQSLYVPIVRMMCKSLFEFSRNGSYDDAANVLRKILRCVSTRGGPGILDSPLLSVVNNLLSVHLLRNDFQNCDRLLKNVAPKTAVLSNDVFPVSEIVTFYFLSGKVNIMFGQMDEARQNLQRALKWLPKRQMGDRRLVLAYLVPVNMSFGVMPSNGLIEEYGLQFYAPVVEAITNGNLGLFDQYLEENQLKLIRIGVWEVIVLARRMAERSLLQMIHAAHGGNIIPIAIVRDVVSQFKECSMEEAELMVCNLVYSKLVKANVAQTLGKIVFASKPSDAFPAIACE